MLSWGNEYYTNNTAILLLSRKIEWCRTLLRVPVVSNLKVEFEYWTFQYPHYCCCSLWPNSKRSVRTSNCSSGSVHVYFWWIYRNSLKIEKKEIIISYRIAVCLMWSLTLVHLLWTEPDSVRYYLIRFLH